MLDNLHRQEPRTPPSPSSAQLSPMTESMEPIPGPYHCPPSDIIIIQTTPPSSSSPRNTTPQRIERGSPYRRDLEHLTPSLNPTRRSLDHLRPSLHPLTPIELPTYQTLPSGTSPPICTPAPQWPIAFKRGSKTSSHEEE